MFHTSHSPDKKKVVKVCHCSSSTWGPDLELLKGNAPYETNLHWANPARTHVRKARFFHEHKVLKVIICFLCFFLKDVPCIQWLLVGAIPLIIVSNLMNLWAHALNKYWSSIYKFGGCRKTYTLKSWKPETGFKSTYLKMFNWCLLLLLLLSSRNKNKNRLALFIHCVYCTYQHAMRVWWPGICGTKVKSSR